MKTLLTLFAVLLALQAKTEDFDRGFKTIKALDIQKHQTYIASDELEGRDSGSEGGHKAALYIADHLQRLGFEGGAADGSYFQPFGATAASTGEFADANYLKLFKDSTLKAHDLYKVNDAIVPIQTSKCGQVAGSVVFAGYGIMAPEFGYEDYKGINVKASIALVLGGEPQEKDEASKFDGAKPTKYSALTHKIEQAEKAGATALLVVGIPVTRDAWPPPGDRRNATSKIPVAWISAELADKLAGTSGKSIKALTEEIDKEFKAKSFKVGRPVRLGVSYTGPVGKGVKNIIGIWRGTDATKGGETKAAEEFVVLGAHYDHVGRGTSRSNGGKSGQIHNGADDNGSGTSTLLEVAEAIRELKTRRSIAVMWFDGEENGLLGSRHWCSSPTFAVENVVFMINLDMIGRNDITKILLGVEKEGGSIKYPKVQALLQEAEKKFQVKFDWDGADDLIQRSDHWSFMQKGVPAIFYTGGLHPDYHTDRDKVEKINFPKEELIAKLAFWLTYRTATQDGSLK